MKNNIVIKIVLFIVAGVVGAICLIIISASTYTAINFPQVPEKVTLAQAVQMDINNKPGIFSEKPLYVIITDATWECASVKKVDALGTRKDHTDGVFTNISNTALVFVQIDGLYTCQELQKMEVAGKLQRFTKRPVEYQSSANGLVIIDEKSKVITFELCTHCTPAEANFYPVFFLLFPFIMWAIFKYGNRQQQKKVE